MTRKTKITIALVITVFVLGFGLVLNLAFPTTSVSAKGSVTLCHATNSQTNPFNSITIDEEGAYNGHLGSSHQSGRDIIPPFEYDANGDGETETYSQNWDAAGQAIYNNGCDPVPTPTPTQLPSSTPVIPTATPTATEVQLTTTAQPTSTACLGDTCVNATATATAEATEETSTATATAESTQVITSTATATPTPVAMMTAVPDFQEAECQTSCCCNCCCGETEIVIVNAIAMDNSNNSVLDESEVRLNNEKANVLAFINYNIVGLFWFGIIIVTALVIGYLIRSFGSLIRRN